MTIPADGFPRTAAVSPRVAVVDHTDSTNADLRVGSADTDAYPHLSVLLTDDQRAGRGRLDRRWEAPAGTSLALSVLLRLPDLPLAARGWIPLCAGVAVQNAVNAQLGGTSATVKWPNDVLVSGRKLAGILAEATLERSAVVVGIGVNTAMAPEQLPVPTATSFLALGNVCDVDRLVADIVTGLDALTRDLSEASGDAVAAGVREAVIAACGTIGTEVAVSLPDGTTLTGRATGIDAEGRLEVLPPESVEPVHVAAGDVVHLRS